MKPTILTGQLIIIDHEQKTLTFEVENEIIIRTIDYIIMPVSEYHNIIKN